MTELQSIHHQEQMEAHRADFKIEWQTMAQDYPKLATPKNQIAAWMIYKIKHNIKEASLPYKD